jgi:meso-butanediol dehydrogenase/(S,S)-butanediol dehydrogenase/diacetyl reductase
MAHSDAGARFAGRVALITGAGSGIGRAVTLRLTGEGATVFAVDIDGERLKETAELASGPVTLHPADLSSPDACRGVVSACVAAHRRLDVIGNIAGIARGEHVTDVTVEQYRQMMAVNVDACFFLAQSAIPHLLETSGNIVNIASNAALMGQAYTVVYCMSKGAIVQLTRSLAMEFMKAPIRVNAIAPGGTDTPLARTYQVPSDVDFELMSRYVGFRPPAGADDVASVFAFIASDEARSVHGAIISVDNGITAG